MIALHQAGHKRPPRPTESNKRKVRQMSPKNCGSLWITSAIMRGKVSTSQPQRLCGPNVADKKHGTLLALMHRKRGRELLTGTETCTFRAALCATPSPICRPVLKKGHDNNPCGDEVGFCFPLNSCVWICPRSFNRTVGRLFPCISIMCRIQAGGWSSRNILPAAA